jgi:hypothetical protein
MKSFLIFAAFAGLTVIYLWQKHPDTPPTSVTTKSAASVPQPTPPAQLTPAPRGVASEHNWMKRSLDRAADVRDDARAQTKQSQDP